MSSIFPEHIIDLRDESLVAELLPGARPPLSYNEVDISDWQILTDAIFERTLHTVSHMISDIRNDQILALVLSTGSSRRGADAIEWARANGADATSVAMGRWPFSHDGSKEKAFADLLEHIKKMP